MSRDPFTLSDYISHVIDAIEHIGCFIAGLDEATFSRDRLVRDAVIRNVEVVGEACNNIRKRFPEFAAAHPDVPFQPAYEMRNAIAHGYYTIDLHILWMTASKDIPVLRRQFLALEAELKRSL